MTADEAPSPSPTVVCTSCGKPYRQTGRGNGDWFHFMVVAVRRQSDGRARISGHWRAGDWTDGMPLVVRTRQGHRVTVIGAHMEPPLNSTCEARGQRQLIVADLGPSDPNGCIHAAR
ncbi:hypothetical protein [Embleya hyalina]|uniref:Uncharacterized protein n=1 Tax=Embleya hyalina TaxID=516124 RepID=A0A401YWW3_9ACTN|nr:hypothetical protein [Embleya hyalina]GCD99079.1 hypothetical protein EHYA_06791 [Embleya hyalina]